MTGERVVPEAPATQKDPARAGSSVLRAIAAELYRSAALMLATSCWMTGFITLSNMRSSLVTPPPKPPTLTRTALSSARASSAHMISPVEVSIKRAFIAATKLRLPAEKPGSRDLKA